MTPDEPSRRTSTSTRDGWNLGNERYLISTTLFAHLLVFPNINSEIPRPVLRYCSTPHSATTLLTSLAPYGRILALVELFRGYRVRGSSEMMELPHAKKTTMQTSMDMRLLDGETLDNVTGLCTVELRRRSDLMTGRVKRTAKVGDKMMISDP